MRYTTFEKEFLVAAYQEGAFGGNHRIKSGQLIDQYPLQFSPGWVHQLVREYTERGLFIGRATLGDERSQPIGLTPEGMRQAERLIDEGVSIFKLEDLSDDQDPTAAALARLAPASDRIVTLSHNYRDYENAIVEVEAARNAISNSNLLGEDYKSDSLIHIDAGLSLLKKASNVAVGAIKYLVIDRLQGAIESIIEDALKIVIFSALTVIAVYLIGLL